MPHVLFKCKLTSRRIGIRQSLLGFSLIELFVVIAVLAALSAFLIPVVQRVRGGADSVKCASNLRQIGAALNSYANDNDNRYPVTYGPARTPPDKKTWAQKIAPYAGMSDDAMGSMPLPRVTGIFVCPAQSKQAIEEERHVSYCYNEMLLTVWQYQRQDMDPSSFFLVVESEGINTELFNISNRNVARRHPEGAANFLYADGHVESIREQINQDDPRWGLRLNN